MSDVDSSEIVEASLDQILERPSCHQGLRCASQCVIQWRPDVGLNGSRSRRVGAIWTRSEDQSPAMSGKRHAGQAARTYDLGNARGPRVADACRSVRPTGIATAYRAPDGHSTVLTRDGVVCV